MNLVTPTKKPRIEVVDALRGLAIAAIVLLHCLERFNLFDFPKESSELINSMNAFVWDATFFIFAGKAYSMFALLFGFSFFIQYNNRKKIGEDFTWRYLWRLVILLGFGYLNSVFYPGDILILYAIIGVVMLPVRALKSSVVLVVAIVLLLQPIDIFKFIYALANPAYQLPPDNSTLWPELQAVLVGDSWIELIKFNVVKGVDFTLTWAWDNGRFLQTAALFMFGMLLGRNQLFSPSEKTYAFWKRVLVISAILFVPLYYVRINLHEWVERAELLTPLKLMFLSWSNVSFTLILISGFVLLWYKTKFQKVQSHLVLYGRMSLTNYITAGILGAIIFYGVGFAMYKYCGHGTCLLIGFLMFFAQLAFSKWWLKRHKQGPLEIIWGKLTWIRFRKTETK